MPCIQTSEGGQTLLNGGLYLPFEVLWDVLKCLGMSGMRSKESQTMDKDEWRS